MVTSRLNRIWSYYSIECLIKKKVINNNNKKKYVIMNMDKNMVENKVLMMINIYKIILTALLIKWSILRWANSD